MNVLQFILFKQNGFLTSDGKTVRILRNHIVVADESIIANNHYNNDVIFITCYPENLLCLHKSIINPAQVALGPKPIKNDIFRMFTVDNSIIASAEKLMSIEKSLPICFLYLYLIGVDRCYFSNLLCQFIGGNLNNTLLDFFEQNYINPWAVGRYARELGISTHKLNVVFYQQYGMPVKQWLMEKRLKKGGELLVTTTLRVAEIAQRCGFSNHAHFTALFRRRFQICPSLFRTLTQSA